MQRLRTHLNTVEMTASRDHDPNAYRNLMEFATCLVFILTFTFLFWMLFLLLSSWCSLTAPSHMLLNSDIKELFKSGAAGEADGGRLTYRVFVDMAVMCCSLLCFQYVLFHRFHSLMLNFYLHGFKKGELWGAEVCFCCIFLYSTVFYIVQKVRYKSRLIWLCWHDTPPVGSFVNMNLNN